VHCTHFSGEIGRREDRFPAGISGIAGGVAPIRKVQYRTGSFRCIRCTPCTRADCPRDVVPCRYARQLPVMQCVRGGGPGLMLASTPPLRSDTRCNPPLGQRVTTLIGVLHSRFQTVGPGAERRSATCRHGSRINTCRPQGRCLMLW